MSYSPMGYEASRLEWHTEQRDQSAMMFQHTAKLGNYYQLIISEERDNQDPLFRVRLTGTAFESLSFRGTLAEAQAKALPMAVEWIRIQQRRLDIALEILTERTGETHGDNGRSQRPRSVERQGHSSGSSGAARTRGRSRPARAEARRELPCGVDVLGETLRRNSRRDATGEGRQTEKTRLTIFAPAIDKSCRILYNSHHGNERATANTARRTDRPHQWRWGMG